MDSVFKGYLRLCRPPNLPTAAADILAGMALAGFFVATFPWLHALFLVGSSVLLYAGGVVLNDVFDYQLDKEERPERPIPSGLIPLRNARIFGFLLLGIGIAFAFGVNNTSALLSVLLAISIVGYDIFSKKDAFLGPLNMGLCRGFNLLLGLSVLQDLDLWPYALIPVLFIFAVTLISRGEVHGNNRRNIVFAAVLYVLVIVAVVVLHLIYDVDSYSYLMYLLGFALMVFVPLQRAYVQNNPKNIMKAVKAGVLSLILLDAALATAHSNWKLGLGILLLLPLSFLLSRAFAVT